MPPPRPASLLFRRARAIGALGLLAASLAASCGPSQAARFPPVAFADLACTPSGRVECRLLKEGGIGCCTADIDGSSAAWTCPIGLEHTFERAPVPMPGLSSVAEITAGGSHMCARSRGHRGRRRLRLVHRRRPPVLGEGNAQLLPQAVRVRSCSGPQ